nr:NACHT, LRR and PYD domains-containing protein 12-like [Nerophis lumbriciformis]
MAQDSRLRELLWNTLMELGEEDFASFRFHTDLPESERENTSREYIAGKLLSKHGDNTLGETVKILEKIWNKDLAQKLHSNMLNIKGAVFSVHDDNQINRLKGKLQEHLKGLYSFASEGTTERWKQQPLADVYTELDVTYGADVIPDERHEVLQMETSATAAKESILPCGIFKRPDGNRRPIRTMLTVGFAGIGKTFLIQKFVSGWASGSSNQDMDFIFPFTFRELNMDKGKRFTLAELIRCYICRNRHMSKETLNNIFADLQMSDKQDYDSSRIKILFILDGLDECNFKIDLKNTGKVDMDVREAYPLEVLLAYLINGNLLPCARVWITTRPAAARDIPSDLIDSRTEVRGFSDSRRLEYFRKRFPNEERVIDHIRKSRNIFIMCHIPIFCWLTARVLQHHLDKGKKGELPTTLTNMYSALIGHLLENSKERNTNKYILDVKALAKLAFDHTMKNCQIFYEKDLVDSGFDYSQAAKHSGIFTEVFKEVPPLKRNKQKMFQFVHLTIQEYLAALYVMMSLFHDKKNVLDDSGWLLKKVAELFKQTTITEVHQSALQKASESEGKLDMFLRFLFGLSLPCNQELVEELLKAPQACGQSKSKTVELIMERIKQNTPEKNVNLFYCLNELKDDSLLKQIQQELASRRLSWGQMSNDMWSALAFFLLTDDETMKSFNLASYSRSRLGLKKLLLVVKASQTSDLSKCWLDKGSCHLLASVLSSPSNLRHLDLSSNYDVSDEEVEILSKGLASPHCNLEVLTLFRCRITSKGCVSLAEALKLNPSHLQELDLTRNDLSDEGVEILSKGLASPHCILKILKLHNCGITHKGCVSLAETLKLNPSHLQELDLSENHVSNDGVEILSKGLASPNCIVTPSHLQELDLTRNDLSDEGVEILSKGLARPHCILKILNLTKCSITQRGCISLAEALKVTSSHLQELDLSWNNPSDEGIEILSKGLASPHCILKVLKLSECGIADKGCISLAKALKLNPSHLQKLNLRDNRIEEKGKRVLLDIKEDPSYSLKTVKGLSSAVKDELAAREDSSGLEDLISLSVKLDNRLKERERERALEQRGRRGSSSRYGPATLRADGFVESPSTSTPTRSPVLAGEEPMQLGSGRLSTEERRRRMRAGLCLYCGLPGHHVAACDAISSRRPGSSAPGVPLARGGTRIHEPVEEMSSEEPVVPETLIIGALRWEVERLVEDSLRGVRVPGGCPAGKLFVPDAQRAVIDRFSKMAHFVALPKLPSALETADLLVTHVFRTHGIPSDLVSDRGPQFVSRVWRAFCKALGATSTPCRCKEPDDDLLEFCERGRFARSADTRSSCNHQRIRETKPNGLDVF